VLEKAREAGQTAFRALCSIRVDERTADGIRERSTLDAEVHKEAVYFLTRTGHHSCRLRLRAAGSWQLRHLINRL